MEKCVLVTGANGGIGKATVSKLLENEYKVISLDIKDDNIKGLDTTFIKCDVSKKEDVTNAYQKVKEITDELYAIVNAIGIFMMESIIEGKEEDLRKIFDINFFGVYQINKTMFPLLKRDSRIINITSELARYSPQPFQGYYNLSKITLDNYTDVLRRECNYLDIKVIKIQSGSMKTPLLKSADDEYEQMVKESEHFKKPLTKLKYMMDRELEKTNDPSLMGNLIVKILKKKNPRLVYKIKNSGKLSLMSSLPEKWQDDIYKKVIK